MTLQAVCWADLGGLLGSAGLGGGIREGGAEAVLTAVDGFGNAQQTELVPVDGAEVLGVPGLTEYTITSTTTTSPTTTTIPMVLPTSSRQRPDIALYAKDDHRDVDPSIVEQLVENDSRV